MGCFLEGVLDLWEWVFRYLRDLCLVCMERGAMVGVGILYL